MLGVRRWLCVVGQGIFRVTGKLFRRVWRLLHGPEAGLYGVFSKKFSVSNFSDFRKPVRQLFGKIKVDDQGSQNERRGLRDQVSRRGQIPNIQPVETRLREVTQSKEPDFGALVLVYLC